MKHFSVQSTGFNEFTVLCNITTIKCFENNSSPQKETHEVVTTYRPYAQPTVHRHSAFYIPEIDPTPSFGINLPLCCIRSLRISGLIKEKHRAMRLKQQTKNLRGWYFDGCTRGEIPNSRRLSRDSSIDVTPQLTEEDKDAPRGEGRGERCCIINKHKLTGVQ